jgi:hypothetical protein
MTTNEIAMAIAENTRMADLFAARVRQAKLDADNGAYLENIRKFEEVLRWNNTLAKYLPEEATHFDNVA